MATLVVLLLPRGGDQFLLAPGDFGLVISTCASTAPVPAALLGLRELALEGLHLNEGHVGLRFGMTITRAGVDADDIAGHELEIFKGQRCAIRRRSLRRACRAG